MDRQQACTRATDAAAALAGLTPSIISLGEQYAAALAAYERFDAKHAPKAFAADTSSRAAQRVLADRMGALVDLIATMPAATLADVAVQVHAVGSLAARVNGETSPAQALSVARQIERMAYGMLPLVAAVAGLDMAAMGWAGNAGLRVERFAGVGVKP